MGAKGGTRLVLGVAALVLTLIFAGSASAAETTIGFDHFPGGAAVPSGTSVGVQWEAEGLKLGKAEEFGQATVSGDCGKPTAESETIVAASSPPNFALLATCFGAFNTQGTFGALTAPARGTVSVEVRIVNSGSPVAVTVRGYNGSGELVAEGHGEASSGSWQRIAASSSGAQISYFAIATAIVTSQEVAIDNLGFETPPSQPPPGGGGTPPPPTPPTASLAVTTPQPHAGQPINLSGAGSSAGSGRIISYGWNFRGGEKEETSTGTDPNAQVMFGPGAHTITLIVTNSNHEQSTTHLGLQVPPPTLKAQLPDGGEGECKATLEIGDARLLAECIQKLGEGYVIQGRLAINGMVLIPRNGFLKIKTVNKIGIGTTTELYGAIVDIELPNTPLGTMALGSRDLEAEPIPLESHAFVPPKFEGLFHGFRGKQAAGGSSGGGGSGGGTTKPGEVPKPAKTLLYVFGVGKQCKPGETTKAGCCPPPNGHIVCAEIPGNFPITGLVDVFITNTGKTLLDVQVGLNLKEVNLEATGALEIIVNDESGIELQSMQFEIGEAALKPIFKIKGASFQYYFPSYFEESKADTWQAKGTITFGEEVAQLKAAMAFKKGNFRSAAMSLKIKPGVPVFSGVFLNEIGATLGVEPLEFGGSLGASISETLELELEFRYREMTEKELGYFGGEGRLLYKESKIASLAADVYSDGYVDAALKIELKLPLESKSPLVYVRGGLSFWDEPNHQPEAWWQVQGEAYVKIWIIEVEGLVLVNNKDVAGCAGVNGFGVQGHYSFEDSTVGGGLFAFSNCSDQLREFKEKAIGKHTGGFVKEESERAPGTGRGGLASHGRAAATPGESETFDLPPGTEGQELRVNATSGTPILRITGPDGHTYTTPASPGQSSSVAGQFISAIAPNTSQVLILLKHPKGGQWTVQALPGSGPLGKIEAAEDVAPARVRVHVHHAHGHSWALSYRIAHHVPGTKVSFVERGKDSTHVLGTVSAAHGTLRFTPAEAISRGRKIYAYLLNSEGVQMRDLAVGSYTAPAPFKPGRPKVRIIMRRSTAVVSWRSVAGARGYRITVRGSDGRLETHILKGSSHSVVIPNALGFESFTATVTAVGGKDMLRGRAGSARLTAARVQRRGHRHRKH